MKVYLTQEKEKVGWVEIRVHFVAIPTEVVTLVFDTALIRRKVGGNKCRVKVEIGEEVLETRVCEDKEDSPPNWKEDVLTFYVLKSEPTEGIITVLAGDT